MSARHLAFSLQSSAFRLFLLISFTLAFLSFTFPAHAADPVMPEPTSKPALEAIGASNYGPDKHLLYTLMNLGGYAAGCLGEGSPLFGGDCIDMVGKVGPNGQVDSGATPYLVNSSIRSGGALGAIGGAMIALGTTRPTNPVEYVASIGESFGIKSAYAQTSGIDGSGNSVIEPIFKIWQLTRNISYFGFILVFMAIGFMIMFRQKLNPQTVISAQNALPGVVVALILVTFSYLIAAFIVDLGFVTTQLTGRLISINGLANQDNINETLEKRNLFDIFGTFISPSPPSNDIIDRISSQGEDINQVATATRDSLSFLNQGFTGQIIRYLSAGLGCYGAQSAIGGLDAFFVPTVPGGTGPAAPRTLLQQPGVRLLSRSAGCIGGGLAGFAFADSEVGSSIIFYGIGVILYVILLIALLVAMIRTFFELIKAYVTIMIQTVIAPIVILTGAIPGQGGAFSGWAKTIIANVLIFPAVFAAFFFAAFIKGKPEIVFGIPQNVAGDFSQITSTIPLLGGLTGEFIQLILTYGILLMIPSIPGEVKKAFKVQDSPLGGAAIATAAAGYGLGRGFIGKGLEPYAKERQILREARAKAAVLDPSGAPKRTGLRPWITWFNR